MLELIIILVALLFAANIGASNAAAAMGEAHGSGAIRRRGTALALVALSLLAGAAFAGGGVAHTLSDGVVPQANLSLSLALVVLLAATVPLTAANYVGIPLSTSEVAVGALVGVGIVAGGVDLGMLAMIVVAWALLPLLGFLLTGAGTRGLSVLPNAPGGNGGPLFRRLLIALLVIGGIYAGFSAGANNVANAIAPLVAVSILEASEGLLVGGVALAVGAFFLGRRVLHTNSSRIAELDLGTGILVTVVIGTLVLAASLVGLPVPLAQSKTASILGASVGRSGWRAFDKQIVRDIGTAWLLSPVLSLLLAYFMAHVAMDIGPGVFRRPLSYVLMAAGAAVIGGTLLLINRPRLIWSYVVLRGQASSIKRMVTSLVTTV